MMVLIAVMECLREVSRADFIMFNSKRPYSLRQSRQILKASYKNYVKQGKALSPSELSAYESNMQALDQDILEGDRIEASTLAKSLEVFNSSHFKKSFFSYVIELIVALVFALIIATIIRQMWFEPYEIPSGSMRPTFKEQDRLTVTKTAFGINVPLMTKHLYFDPKLVQRTSVFIWSGDGIANLDSDANFMNIIPYTKRYIKRCMGKPGDTLYFYGGQIYGFDQEGNELIEFRNSPWMEQLEYVPFARFEGRSAYSQEPRQSLTSQVVFNQINQATGRIKLTSSSIKGEIFNGKEWIKDEPDAQKKPHSTLKTYSDFFGMRNYAMTRLLTKKQVEALNMYDLKSMEDGLLYLELRHTPSLTYPQPLIERFGIFLGGYKTLIPIQERHLKALMDNMYTARFIIKNGRATRYHQEGAIRFSDSSPLFPNVPDGVYEFYYGKAYSIDWGGIAFQLPLDHPLYKETSENVQKLYNVGIEVANDMMPKEKNQIFFPHRYAYFRNGDLYLLGASIFGKQDPILNSFIQREKRKEDISSNSQPYVAFKDYGPPVDEKGNLDKEFLSTFGYKVPEGHYLALGDNHAMSQDSRYFGPIPQANLQGAPSFIFWPPGERWGVPAQKPYPLITLPRLIIWGIFGILLLISYLIYRKRLKTPIFKKVTF